VYLILATNINKKGAIIVEFKKRLLAIILCIAMCASVSTTAFASNSVLPSMCKNYPTQQQGSKNGYVGLIQAVCYGYGPKTKAYLGSSVADGIFGSGTKKAVSLFQTEQGLSVDGVVGTNTWQALMAQPDFSYEKGYLMYYVTNKTLTLYRNTMTEKLFYYDYKRADYYSVS
jgi:peptidoglycan hydrolase-like protein with peptidoglycan-binding domain